MHCASILIFQVWFRVKVRIARSNVETYITLLNSTEWASSVVTYTVDVGLQGKWHMMMMSELRQSTTTKRTTGNKRISGKWRHIYSLYAIDLVLDHRFKFEDHTVHIKLSTAFARYCTV